LPVPEVATLLFRHVFPAVQSEDERRAVQRAIFHVQSELESVYAGRLVDGQILLCDRGTVDGGGYWPSGHRAFFEAMATAWEHELARYDAVLFLETAAAGGLAIDHGNPVRTEDIATAVAIDRRLHDVWSSHPNFFHVPHARRFADKLAHGTATFERWLASAAAPHGRETEPA
jgi:hypothetical protein